MTNKEYKKMLDNKEIGTKELINILNERVKVFTRVTVGNSIIRVDLVPKQNDDDISLFLVLNNIYTYNELKLINIYFPDKIYWNKK